MALREFEEGDSESADGCRRCLAQWGPENYQKHDT